MWAVGRSGPALPHGKKIEDAPPHFPLRNFQFGKNCGGGRAQRNSVWAEKNSHGARGGGGGSGSLDDQIGK